MGMALLQKMGWKPGEGLGKNKEGTLQPLLLEVKMDKKGKSTIFFVYRTDVLLSKVSSTNQTTF